MSVAEKSRVAASVRQRLLNLAKERGEDFNLVLTRFALERFLYRLSQSSHKATLILKGAMLFQVWSEIPHRATRDLDFLAQGKTDDIALTIREICNAEVEKDGLQFELAQLDVNEIREDDRYGGVRARFIARLGRAEIPVQLDFGIGDAVTPAPEEIDYPTLLDMAHPYVLAYPRETVVAEKLEAIIDLGMANSRMKDFFDLWFILTTFDDDPSALALAVKRTFERREQAIPIGIPIGLSDEFAADPDKQKQWAAFVARTLSGAPPLVEVIALIRQRAVTLFNSARA